DFWGGATACIEIVDALPADCLDGIDAFSHAEVVFVFHLVAADKIVAGARHPRNNAAWPRVGIFAQRAKNRPNQLGTTLVPIVRREGRRLWVAELDAVDGTPVVDIKPVMREFLPRSEVRQPPWATELMADYWSLAPGS